MASSSVEITTGKNTVIVYDDKGESRSIGPESVNVFELKEGQFCTVSVPVNAEDGEHIPEDEIPAFAKKMLAFWKNVVEQIQDPTATPV